MKSTLQTFVARPEYGVAWITAAATGVGRELALKLARDGFTVAVTAKNHQFLVELAAEAADAPGHIAVLDGDVTNPADMQRIIAAIEYEYGAIALAVFGGGVFVPVDGSDLHAQDFDRSFSINLAGVVNCLLPTIRHMQGHGQGQIAIMSSTAGYGGLPANAAYGATSAALINMAESLKYDLDRLGIRIQVIDAGATDRHFPTHMLAGIPLHVTPQEAAGRIVQGLQSNAFEISVPRRHVLAFKLLRLVPYRFYFPLVSWIAQRKAGGHGADLHPAE